MSGDRLRAGMAGEGWLRWAAVDIGNLVEGVRERLDLSPLSVSVLGRALAGAALLQQFSSGGAQRVVLEIVGRGPISSVVAEADERGRVRGMVEDPRAESVLDERGELAVGTGIGGGRLKVVRVRDGRTHHSQVKLTTGDVGDGLAHYLLQSEQTRSAVLVGMLAMPSGVAAAGGVMIEALPGVPEECLARLESRIAACASISRELHAGGLEGVLQGLLPSDREELQRRGLRYECGCSRDRVREYLRKLVGEGALPEESIEVACRFCGETYSFAGRDLS